MPGTLRAPTVKQPAVPHQPGATPRKVVGLGGATVMSFGGQGVAGMNCRGVAGDCPVGFAIYGKRGGVKRFGRPRLL